MKDKEQEEDISWLFLWGAAILYITVICMTFAGLVALDEHGKSVVVIFTAFVKDYGSLLAGIPVLIAVLVAKQQLDANRRQHVAQIRRSFQKELDALTLVKEFLDFFDGKSWDDIVKETSLFDSLLNIPGFNEATILTIETAITPNFAGHVKTVNLKLQRLERKWTDGVDLSTLQKEYEYFTDWLAGLRKNHDANYDRLSQYWS
ncbi:hypothetical protein [Paenochrobactrum pullorum]|uniref:hypothetical protein n=1 Tax=Paenochrobactrum pullorum TaxID=1324351 RepID=UPI0035BBEBF4